MTPIAHNPTTLFPRYRCYHHAVEIPAGARLLVISGLNGYLADGKTLPDSFEEQAEVIWGHIHTLLADANMSVRHLVSLRFYLADPNDDEANVRLRVKHLGDHACALTVICCQLLDPRWKVEIEAMAAA